MKLLEKSQKLVESQQEWEERTRSIKKGRYSGFKHEIKNGTLKIVLNIIIVISTLASLSSFEEGWTFLGILCGVIAVFCFKKRFFLKP